MSLNPHEMDSEFQSDDDRQNSDGGGNIEFVRYERKKTMANSCAT